MSVTGTLARLTSFLLFTLFATFAGAQDRPPYGPSVDLATAKKITAAAMEEAKKNKWNVAVAIVDTHGFLVYFEKMDDTQTASVQVAIDKARSAAIYRRPTRAFADVVAKGGVYVITLAGMSAVPGGLHIMSNGKVIGAIGTSGVTADQDEQVSKAGLSGM